MQLCYKLASLKRLNESPVISSSVLLLKFVKDLGLGNFEFIFAYDLPRFVKSTPLIKNFKGTLPNQHDIDRALAEYEDDVSRGFIVLPSSAIDYSGDIPYLSSPSYSSAMNALGQPKGAPPPPPPSGGYSPGPFNSSH